MNMKVYQQLRNIVQTRGAGHLVLLDPDKQSINETAALAASCQEQGVDGFLIGGSLLFAADFDDVVRAVKKAVSVPVILFPGGMAQLSAHADAVLFMSLISGRNPHFLVGEQVRSAPIVKAMGLEPISTGYILIESGEMTSVAAMSDTRPLPRHKPEITVAHALAGQYLGMQCIYLEAGSGAKVSVPEPMIHAVRKTINIPLIVGGGIRTPESAKNKVQAGANFVVTGNVIEGQQDLSLIGEIAQAIHQC